ncbi:MAG: aspartate aminotransferase family protein, partial [Candidatus Ranarchaeia archaeon]
LSKLITCPGIFYNDARAKLGQKLAEITPKELTTTFLSNSGTESVECAIKLARKATGKPEIIALKRGFHGRTLGALSTTWTKKYRDPFKPLLSSVSHADTGSIDAIRENYTDKTAAIIVEPIQGEGGVIVHPPGYLKELREFCNEKGVLLIFDEVQTGMGRTGKMFAFQYEKVTPDILCLAKGLAGGVPIGATVASKELFSHLKPGEHGSTFGGNPLSSAAAVATIKILQEEKLVENSAQVGEYFLSQLEPLKTNNIVKEIRGRGLMIGVQHRVRVGSTVKKALDQGILLLTAGISTIRMLPPLILSKANVDFAMDKISTILESTLNESR